MFDKDTGNYKEGFVFDEFYLSMIGNKDNNVALPTNNLNGEDQIVVKDLLNQILPLYKEIQEKFNKCESIGLMYYTFLMRKK